MRFFNIFASLAFATSVLSAASPRFAADTTTAHLDKRALFEIPGLSDLADTLKSLKQLLDVQTLSEIESVVHYGSVLLDENSTKKAKALLSGAGELLGEESPLQDLLKNAGALLSTKNVESINGLFGLLDMVSANPSFFLGIAKIITNAATLLDDKTTKQIKEIVDSAHTSLPLLTKILKNLGGA